MKNPLSEALKQTAFVRMKRRTQDAWHRRTCPACNHQSSVSPMDILANALRAATAGEVVEADEKPPTHPQALTIMKLYFISAEIDVSADGIAFEPFNKVCVSQAECASTRAELTSKGVKRKDIATYEVDVPTGKAELVTFLNNLLCKKFTSAGVSHVATIHKLVK